MENYEIIEKYLNGELTNEELKSFKLQLSDDKELKKELNLITDVNEFLKNDELEFRNELKEMIVNYKNSSKKKNFSRNYFLKPISIAATILILTGLSIYFYYNFENSSLQLFNKYYQPYQYSVIQRSGENLQNKENLILAFNEYNNQNYAKAIVLFNKSLEKETTNRVAEFLLANCYMQTNQIDLALNTLNHLSRQEGNLLENNITWYSGLCYLKLQENEKAKQMFKKLANKNNFYTKKAKKLLRKIK